MVNLVTALPNVSSTGVLSMQSIPPRFAPTLSTFLNARSRFEVQPFKDKMVLNPGRCYIGTSGQYMQFGIEAGMLVLNENKNSAEDSGQESVDYILSSAAELFQDRVMVVLLSGGSVGKMDGLRAVKSAGGRIIAPEPDSSILPDSFMGAIDEGLIAEVFDSADVRDVLTRFCG
jgi:chemotaxis response regulator CheB